METIQVKVYLEFTLMERILHMRLMEILYIKHLPPSSPPYMESFSYIIQAIVLIISISIHLYLDKEVAEVIQDIQVFKVIRVSQEHKVQRVKRVKMEKGGRLEIRVILENKVTLAQMVLKVIPVSQAHKEYRVSMVRLVLKESKGYRENKE